MPTIVLLRNVIAGDLPIFFGQRLDLVANQMAAFPARDREAFCHAQLVGIDLGWFDTSGSTRC